MSVFKKIATPFVAAGRWIKETAWVQPLLIVGVIFGIIFCIPSITAAIQQATAQTDIKWYEQNWLKLENSATNESVVNNFFEDYVTAQKKWASNDKKGAKEQLDKYSGNNGGRFLLFFVQDNCSACAESKEACEYTTDNWDSFVGDKFPTFAYQSIICDQKLDGEEYKKNKPFDYLYGDFNFVSFCEDTVAAAQISNYYKYGTEASTIKTNVEKLLASDSDSTQLTANFQTPMIIEFNLDEKLNNTDYIISTVMYKFDGTDKETRSETFVKMWKRLGIFSDNGKATE